MSAKREFWAVEYPHGGSSIPTFDKIEAEGWAAEHGGLVVRYTLARPKRETRRSTPWRPDVYARRYRGVFIWVENEVAGSRPWTVHGIGEDYGHRHPKSFRTYREAMRAAERLVDRQLTRFEEE